MHTTTVLEEPHELTAPVKPRAKTPAINTNKLHATLCILLSAAVSIGTIYFLVRTFL